MKYKATFVATMLALGFSTPTFATIWSGTITETITGTNNPGFEIGQTFIGSYSFESDELDGDYLPYANPYGSHPDGLGTLKISIYDFAGNYWRTGTDLEFRLWMTVSNGVVSDFRFDGESGMTDFGFFTNSFYETNHNPIGRPPGTPGTYSESGSMSFSNPVAEIIAEESFSRLSASVPDAAATFALFATGLGSLALYGRRRVSTRRV